MSKFKFILVIFLAVFGFFAGAGIVAAQTCDEQGRVNLDRCKADECSTAATNVEFLVCVSECGNLRDDFVAACLQAEAKAAVEKAQKAAEKAVEEAAKLSCEEQGRFNLERCNAEECSIAETPVAFLVCKSQCEGLRDDFVAACLQAEAEAAAEKAKKTAEEAKESAKLPTLYDPFAGTTVPVVVGRAINAVLSIVGSISLVIFVYAGIMWMTSAGNEEKARQAAKMMVWAAIGLFVIFSSYVVLTFVFGQVLKRF